MQESHRLLTIGVSILYSREGGLRRALADRRLRLARTTTAAYSSSRRHRCIRYYAKSNKGGGGGVRAFHIPYSRKATGRASPVCRVRIIGDIRSVSLPTANRFYSFCRKALHKSHASCPVDNQTSPGQKPPCTTVLTPRTAITQLTPSSQNNPTTPTPPDHNLQLFPGRL